jgi:prephenate dehydrogenase
MVEIFGGRPVLLSAEEHDRMVAYSSHLPQLLSTGLAGFLSGSDLKRVAGPGLMDMTRLALSSYELWDDILVTNSTNVDTALAGLIEELEQVRIALRDGRAAECFERGNRFATNLRS